MQTLDIPDRKILRSKAIFNFVDNFNIEKVVIFSCGNASETLKMVLANTNIDILDISPTGKLSPTEYWWSKQEIKLAWPDRFDATSGHLPLVIMNTIAKTLRVSPLTYLPFIPVQGQAYQVPTGSGETIVCLRQAFPESLFLPVYNISAGTQYNPQAPLNKQVLEGTPLCD